MAFVIALPLQMAMAQAKDLEPRSYSNIPVGMNFLLAGYVYTEGQLAFDPSTAITDAEFDSHTEVLAYARALSVGGSSAKIDVVLPYSSFSAHGLLDGQPRERKMSGPLDPRLRFSMNFHGAPALSLKEFASYQQDLIIGASLQVTAPLGQYDDDRLLNLGNNRWSFKTELGVSKAWGPWTLEVMPSVTFYTDNTDFFNGSTLEQNPLYAVQGHLIRSLPQGIWMSLNGTYFRGERTTLNGVEGDNMQSNTRAGLTLAIPVDRHHSLKLYASTGTSTRTGSDFDAVGIAWQYRWGEGY